MCKLRYEQGWRDVDDGSIFRRDALEHRARRTERGDVLRAAPPWTTWVFYLLVAIFTAGIIVATRVGIDRVVLGQAAVDDSGRVVVLEPVGPVDEIAVGQKVEIGETTAEVLSVQGSVVVTSAADVPREGTPVRIIVGSDPVITLVPGLRILFGGGDA